jgi:hypothetical protein
MSFTDSARLAREVHVDCKECDQPVVSAEVYHHSIGIHRPSWVPCKFVLVCPNGHRRDVRAF